MAEGQGQHLIMVPWLAFGHLTPFLHLAIGLAKAGFRISFISTPKNIQRLPKPPQDVTAQITFIEFPLPHVDDGLKEGVEATMDLDDLNEDHLRKAFHLLRDPVKHFITIHSPDWIIHDIHINWTAEIAQELGIPFVVFSIFPAAPLAFVGLGQPEEGPSKQWPRSPHDLTCPPPWIRFPSKNALLPHEAQWFFHGLYQRDESGTNYMQRLLKSFDGCEAITIRTCPEYEGDYLNVLKSYPKPVIPVGLLPPEKQERTHRDNEEWAETFRWLDGKETRSVVFVGFGSEIKMSRNDIHEIAQGLESSNLGFLLALRRPKWASDDCSDALPPGFVSRTVGRGLVIMGWAPQTEILAHPAIGGSLVHAGMSSTIESLQHGHPLVLLPFLYDQGNNARVAVEKGVAIEIERDEDGTFHREAIARALRLAMVEEDGERLRSKSNEMKAIFCDQELHQRPLSKLVGFLKNFNTK